MGLHADHKLRLMRRLTLALLLLAMVAVRGLIAPGMMPGTDADGRLILTLCDNSGGAPAHVSVAMHGSGQDDGDSPQADAPCPFMVLADAPLIPAAASLAAHAEAYSPPPAPVVRALALGAIAPMPPATGPPLA